jgi:hypothetical protein
VCLVVAGALLLRAHALGSQPLDDDELASTRAVLAIARAGLPRYSADVYYSRSPLYHYFAGALVRVLGENIWALRLPSLLFGGATTLLVYLVGARLLRSRWTGLVAAALYAVHPYAIFVGHLVRFYQQQQFFTLATAYLFCRGFVEGQRVSARYLAVATFLAACLSQELSVVLVPPMLIAYVLLAEKKGRGSMAGLVVISACAGAALVIDLLVFQTWCLTRLEGMSPNVEASLAFHFSSPLNLLTMFVSYSRLHVALSVVMAVTFPLLARERSRSLFTWMLFLFVGTLATNLLVTGTGLRYQYWLLPLWLLLGVHGVRALVLAVSRPASTSDATPVRAVAGPALGVLALASVLLSWSPWKIPGSYEATLLGDSTSAFAYVRSHLRPGDRVAATEPHSPAGLIEAGQIDYDLAVPVFQDLVYKKDGRLVDRIGGAEVLGSVEDLKQVIARQDRVWILVNREKLRSRGANIMWQYPAARVEQFLRENCAVRYQSYLWTVFLWDAGAGKYKTRPLPYAWQDPT